MKHLKCIDKIFKTLISVSDFSIFKKLKNCIEKSKILGHIFQNRPRAINELRTSKFSDWITLKPRLNRIEVDLSLKLYYQD
ncbi:hypothetical protein BpHYR1_020456 [Brachionus plicatilis]|uniref:Uncharacterized protein n=1 Tax=Brachionus plicatilis TaxID=10195 RepID=A0A3M7PXF4_BRAPC|nr:hypothetical protein BpHYR1_020456 [Brachionus plicatilis]